MNREKLEAGRVDYADGLKRFANRAPLYEKYLSKFVTEEDFSNLQAKMAQEDYEEAFKIAHALKGVAGTLSLQPFFKEMKVLVEALRAKNGEEAQRLLPKTVEEYEKIVAVIKESEE